MEGVDNINACYGGATTRHFVRAIICTTDAKRWPLCFALDCCCCCCCSVLLPTHNFPFVVCMPAITRCEFPLLLHNRTIKIHIFQTVAEFASPCCRRSPQWAARHCRAAQHRVLDAESRVGRPAGRGGVRRHCRVRGGESVAVGVMHSLFCNRFLVGTTYHSTLLPRWTITTFCVGQQAAVKG